MDDHAPGIERRKEPRYPVTGVDAEIDGVRCRICDISASALRVERPGGLPIADRPYQVDVRVTEGSKRLLFRILGTVIRHTDDFLVLSALPEAA
jgi:hypothetical protein